MEICPATYFPSGQGQRRTRDALEDSTM